METKIEYPLPDGAMRYSLFEAWQKDKMSAMRTYFPANEEDRQKLYTPWVNFGKFVAEQLALRPVPEWLSDVPVGNKLSEKRLYVDMDGIKVRGTIDLYDPVHLTVEDVKCSKELWTSVKVRKLEQLVYYQVLVEELHGEVNPIAAVHNIPVMMADDKRIIRTGDKCITLTREITADERQRMREKMIMIAKDISIAYQNYLNGLITI